MFNLKDANKGIRKAAALQGISTGKFKPVFDPDDMIVARVYNRNFPNGMEIFAGEVENALNYTWKEINDKH